MNEDLKHFLIGLTTILALVSLVVIFIYLWLAFKTKFILSILGIFFGIYLSLIFIEECIDLGKGLLSTWNNK